MGVVDDIVALEAFVKSIFPTAKTGKQDVPEQPPADSFYIRVMDPDYNTETSYHYRIDRPYEIIHLAERPDTVLANMDRIGAALYQTQLIGHIRINSFSHSQPAKTENGLFVVIGVLLTSVREARIQPVYPKINNVTVRKI